MSSSLKISPAQSVRELLSLPNVIAALESFTRNAEEITRQHIEICSIPASPFQEQRRAEYFRDEFLKLGLAEVKTRSPI